MRWMVYMALIWNAHAVNRLSHFDSEWTSTNELDSFSATWYNHTHTHTERHTRRCTQKKYTIALNQFSRANVRCARVISFSQFLSFCLKFRERATENMSNKCSNLFNQTFFVCESNQNNRCRTVKTDRIRIFTTKAMIGQWFHQSLRLFLFVR